MRQVHCLRHIRPAVTLWEILALFKPTKHIKLRDPVLLANLVAQLVLALDLPLPLLFKYCLDDFLLLKLIQNVFVTLNQITVSEREKIQSIQFA